MNEYIERLRGMLEKRTGEPIDSLFIKGGTWYAKTRCWVASSMAGQFDNRFHGWVPVPQLLKKPRSGKYPIMDPDLWRKWNGISDK